jgi:hypothetical protein
MKQSLKWRVANAVCPHNLTAERVLHRAQFHVAHARWPAERATFNDALYHVKASGLLEMAHRRFVSDKELVKDFVKGLAGPDYVVPTLDILTHADRVRDYAFAPDTIVKPTHSSGQYAFVDDPGEVDRDELIGWLDLDYYLLTRALNYKNLAKKLIVEPLVFGQRSPLDYKFHCFRGEVKFIHVDVGRQVRHTRAFFTPEFERLPFSIGYPIADAPLEAPANLEEMIWVAERLAARFSFIRVDLYSDGEHCCVGEITNVHGNAHEPFFPRSAEAEFGPAFFDHSRAPLDELLTK